MKLNLLSLFCGPGGFDLGFKQAGFHTDLAVDINEAAVETFKKNHKKSVVFAASVTDLTPEMLDAKLHPGKGKIFTPMGVIGGPPCQSFSNANVHQSDDDHRHTLPEHYASLLKKLNDRHPISFFVFENVKGLLGKKHRPRYEKFKKQFKKAGFEIFEKVLDAKDYGVPQERERIIIVGINQKLHPGRVWTPPKKLKGSPKTVRQTISKFPEPVFFEDAGEPEKFPVHPNHWCMTPRTKKFTNGFLKEGDVKGRSFRVLWWDKPSWTVAYGHREVHVHPNCHRRLSIYEAMRLQSFPQGYRLMGNLSEQITQVSDAVPPKLAYYIAKSIRESLNI